MVSVDTDLVNALADDDEYLTARGLVEYLERHRVDDPPGVSRDHVRAYAEALEYDVDRLLDSMESRLTTAERWRPGDRLYETGENVSVYPPAWHERLRGSTDLAAYVRVMLDSVRAPDGVHVDRNALGVAQEDLITALEVMAGVDRNAARGLIKEQRLAGNVVLYAFQNPEELVRLPDDAAD